MSEVSILGLAGVASSNLSGFNQDLRLPMQGLRNVSNKYSSIKYYYSSSRWGPLSQGLVIPVSELWLSCCHCSLSEFLIIGLFLIASVDV